MTRVSIADIVLERDLKKKRFSRVCVIQDDRFIGGNIHL